MNRRILALLLCIVTVATVFAGCGEKKVDEDELIKEQSTRTAVSVNMWVVSDKKVSEETEALVEQAINEVTKSRLTVYVDLIFLTADEYEEKLNARFEAIESAEIAKEEAIKAAKAEAQSLKAAGITTVGTTVTETDEAVTTPEETIINEYGVVELKYPAIPEDQIDIVLVRGKEMLESLVDAGRLTRLDAEIGSTGASKSLTDYISPMLFSYTKVSGGCYGIPNNHIIGEYTYLMVNREMAEKYYIHEDSINDVKDVYDFIEDIKQKETIAPVKAPYDPYQVYFWDAENSSPEFSLLASNYPLSARQEGSKANSKLGVRDVFSISQYTEHMLRMKKYTDGGYFAKTDSEDFGVAVMTGDYGLRYDYEDKYIVKALRGPIADEKDVYESFFAVSAYTGNLTRSMEVITLLNTTDTIRNILQYGVRGVHYDLDDDGRLHRLNNDYMMNINYTGNVFMAYPEEGMRDTAWSDGRKQNLDAYGHPTLGLSSVWNDIDLEPIKRLDELAKSYYDRMKACKTYDELEAFFAEAKAEMSTNADYRSAVDRLNSDNSLEAVYSGWYSAGWPSAE